MSCNGKITFSNRSAAQEKLSSTRIIEAVAAADGVTETELPPLYETIDPDALNTVVQDGTTVSFDYAGYRVEIEGKTEIPVRDET